MKNSIVIVVLLIAVIHMPAKAQHWQQGGRFSNVPLQFPSPHNIRSAYSEADAVVEGTDDSVPPPSQTWHPIVTFRHIDTTYPYFRSYEVIQSSYQIDGIYYVNPFHGFAFGSHDYYDQDHREQNKSGSWIAEIYGLSGTTIEHDNDSLCLRPLMGVGTAIYLARSATPRNLYFVDYSGPIKELDVMPYPGATIETRFNFGTLHLGPVLLAAFAMRRDNHGLIALQDSNGTTHILRTVNDGASWHELEAFAPSKDAIHFLKVDSTGNFWSGRKAGLLCSTDEGTSWNLRFATSDVVNDIAFGTPRVGIAVGLMHYYVLKTLDSGAHWFRLHFPAGWGAGHVTGFDSMNFAVSEAGGYYETSDAGGRALGFLHFDSDQYSMGVNTYRDTARRFVTAYNYGGEMLRIVSASSDSLGVFVTPSQFILPPGDSLRLSVSFFTRRVNQDGANLYFVNDMGDTVRLIVENLANVVTIEHQHSINQNPVLGVDSSYRVETFLDGWGGGTLQISSLQSLRTGLIFDSIGKFHAYPWGQFYLPLYLHLPQGAAGPDSAFIVVRSNSIADPDTVLLRWNVLSPAAVSSSSATAEPRFALWPNPGSSEVNMFSAAALSVQVYDMLGREREQFVTVPNVSHPISLPRGTYRVIAKTSCNEISSASLLVR